MSDDKHLRLTLPKNVFRMLTLLAARNRVTPNQAANLLVTDAIRRAWQRDQAQVVEQLKRQGATVDKDGRVTVWGMAVVEE